MREYPPLEPLGQIVTNERGKRIFVPFNMTAREEIYIRTENAKADTLLFAQAYLRQRGFFEAAIALDALWDQKPPGMEKK